MAAVTIDSIASDGSASISGSRQLYFRELAGALGSKTFAIAGMPIVLFSSSRVAENRLLRVDL